ncbi:MAG: ATP-binding domain-containing protein [Deltaproteobacteria bacterium]|nr:ATP-binding domain-containing protein [Deltaproteobacteria bacterium]
MVTESGYMKMLDEDRSVEALSRKENLGELAEAVSQFHERNPESTLAEYLEQVSLVQDADLVADDTDSVRLMTLHNAKGLEFPAVFMIGMEEMVLPHSRSITEGAQAIEEERRLCYVGITRARRYLTLSCAARRRSYSGVPTYARPSRFIDEIPEDLVEPMGFALAPSLFREPEIFSEPRGRSFEPRDFPRSSQPRTPRESGETYYDYSEGQEGDADLPLRPGGLVDHDKFGRGRVMGLNGQGKNAKVIVRFESVGVKTLVIVHARPHLRAVG